MKSSILYSYQVDNDDAFRTFADSLVQIELAEKLGFDTCLVSEHHLVENGYFPAPLVVCGSIAMKTTKMRVGTGILLLPLYDPLHVAEHATITDVVSNGRLVLGLGYGYRQEEFDAFGVKLDDRAARMREGIEAIRTMWTNPVATYHGEHFHYDEITVRPFPIQKPHPPIWVAAKTRNAARLAARIGDAWFADPIQPLSVTKDRLATYRQTEKEAGRQSKEFPLMREVFCAETDEQAWEQAKDGMLYVYKEYLQWGHMLDDEGNPVPPGDVRALDLLRKRFIVGSPETCIREATRYRDELGATNLIMRMRFPGIAPDRVLNSIRLWGERVLPAIA